MKQDRSEDLIVEQLTFVQVIVLKCLLRHDASKEEPSWTIYCVFLRAASLERLLVALPSELSSLDGVTLCS